jgi:hypothetical protein
MPKYECSPCDFNTNHKVNYERHLASVKHLNNTTKSFECRYCNCMFGSKQGRWAHEKNSCKSRPDSGTKVIESLVEQLKENNRLLTAQLELKDKQLDAKDKLLSVQSEIKDKIILEQIDVIKGSNKNTGKSMNTLAYVVKHYNKAPAMKKLSDKNAIKMLEYKGKELNSEEMMIHRYRNGTLDAYLGDIITNAFLDADNPSKQSLWTSDVARLCFVIMYPLSKGRREWITDKSGIKITELIIDPLLKNAREMLLVYIKEAGDLHNGTKILTEKSSYSFDSDDSDLESSDSDDSSDSSDDEEEKKPKVKYDKSRKYDQSLVLNMQTAHDIRMIIDNKELHKNVLRHICPFFKLNI